MAKIFILFIINLIFSFQNNLHATAREKQEAQEGKPDNQIELNQDDPKQLFDEDKLTKDIEAALEDVKKRSPDVHADSLRIWKNFKAGRADPHYTYRYWGRDIVLYLQNSKGYTFDSQMKVAQVFGILLKQGIINKDAAHVLSVNVWSQLAYLQGFANPHQAPLSPDQEKDKRRKESARAT